MSDFALSAIMQTPYAAHEARERLSAMMRTLTSDLEDFRATRA